MDLQNFTYKNCWNFLSHYSKLLWLVGKCRFKCLENRMLFTLYWTILESRSSTLAHNFVFIENIHLPEVWTNKFISETKKTHQINFFILSSTELIFLYSNTYNLALSIWYLAYKQERLDTDCTIDGIAAILPESRWETSVWFSSYSINHVTSSRHMLLNKLTPTKPRYELNLDWLQVDPTV